VSYAPHHVADMAGIGGAKNRALTGQHSVGLICCPAACPADAGCEDAALVPLGQVPGLHPLALSPGRPFRVARPGRRSRTRGPDAGHVPISLPRGSGGCPERSAAAGGEGRSGGRQRRLFVDTSSWASLRGRLFVGVSSWTPLPCHGRACPGHPRLAFCSHQRPAGRGRLFVDASSVSWPGLSRPSTTCLLLAPAFPEVVDARPKGGHDGCESRNDDTPPVACGDTLSCRGEGLAVPFRHDRSRIPSVMAGLVPAIHDLPFARTNVPQVVGVSSWASLRGRLFCVMAGPGPAIHDLPCARTNVPQVVGVSSWTPLRGRLFRVMAGLVPAIHVLPCARTSVPQVVGVSSLTPLPCHGRAWPGHPRLAFRSHRRPASRGCPPRGRA
jgi:hypothetical protein